MNRPVFALGIVFAATALVSSVIVTLELAFAGPVAPATGPSTNIPLFEFEPQAQLHCPDDAIVWATANMGIYNSSTDRWYGRTSSGAYACLREAQNAGYRAQSVASSPVVR